MVKVPMISAQGLVKVFGKGQFAVDDVSFDVGSGEIVTLLGPSGCGKTTVLRCIAGFEAPSGGNILVGGKLVSSGADGTIVPTEGRGLGFVHQTYALWPHMTVFDTVSYALELRRTPRAEIYDRVHRALELVRLKGYESRLPSELSGGQQQRVALARSIAYNAAVILLDEPLSNLDAKLREHTRFELRRLFKELGVTVVYVTHDQGEAMAISDRCIVMNGGRIQQVGSPVDLYLSPANSFVADFMGSSNIFDGTRDPRDRAIIDLGWGRFRTDRLQTATIRKVCIKPKDVVLEKDPGKENSFEASVVNKSFVGEFFKIIVQPAGTAIDIALHIFDHEMASASEGDTVLVRFPPQHLQVLTS